MSKEITRRQFLQAASLTVAGLALAACKPTGLDETKEEVASLLPRLLTTDPSETPPPTKVATSTPTILPTPTRIIPTPTATESPEKRKQREKEAKLTSSPQLEWQNVQEENRLLHEGNPNRADVQRQINTLRLCAGKWLEERKISVDQKGFVERAKLVAFSRNDGSILVGLRVVDEDLVTLRGILLALDQKKSVARNTLITADYDDVDSLPVQERPETTFAGVYVDGLLGDKKVDDIIWDKARNTLAGVKLGKIIAYVNPRHKGEEEKIYPGWELTLETRYPMPAGLNSWQQEQWRAFYYNEDEQISQWREEEAKLVLSDEDALFGWLKGKDNELLANWGHESKKWIPFISKLLDVNTEPQYHALSCESVATRMVLDYYQIPVPAGFINWEEFLVKNVPKSDNPHQGFVGNIDADQSAQNYGVYAEPLVKTLAEQGIKAEAFYNQDYQWLVSQIDQGKPVVIWISLERRKGIPMNGWTYVPGEHAVVVFGYRVLGDYFNLLIADPLYTSDSFKVPDFVDIKKDSIPGWDDFNRMALVIEGRVDKSKTQKR